MALVHGSYDNKWYKLRVVAKGDLVTQSPSHKQVKLRLT